MTNLMRASQYREYYQPRPCTTTKASRKQKRRKAMAKKVRFFIFAALALGIALPSVYSEVSDKLLFNRINNAAIDLSVNSSFINGSQQYLYNDVMFGHRFVDNVNVKKPLMLDPYLSNEMPHLKKRLLTLAGKYNSITPGVFVWDYMTGNYVSINGNREFSTASIIKLPLICQLFRRAEQNYINLDETIALSDYYRTSGSGNLQYAPEGREMSINKLAKLMIQNSDNTSTNMILSSVGGVNEFNRSLRQWGFNQTYMKKWLPDLGGSNVSTPKDIGRILYNLDNPDFLSLQSRARIVDIMSNVKNRYLLAAGLPSNAQFIHKTGDIGTMLGDAGIVMMPNGRKYIVVVMAKRPWNSYSAKQFIVKASKIIYHSFAANDL